MRYHHEVILTPWSRLEKDLMESEEDTVIVQKVEVPGHFVPVTFLTPSERWAAVVGESDWDENVTTILSIRLLEGNSMRLEEGEKYLGHWFYSYPVFHSLPVKGERVQIGTGIVRLYVTGRLN